ncbi:hypothetical protein WN944_027523 [Citrus x changshan-huyou]|uniref:Uncharacterized protein n=1 Tax=Citrus x changshan-huyou TaxID=2935761 RepID=A0AAP0LI48_9ROSI
MNRVENGKMGDSWFWILDDIIAIRLISCAPLCKYDLSLFEVLISWKKHH